MTGVDATHHDEVGTMTDVDPTHHTEIGTTADLNATHRRPKGHLILGTVLVVVGTWIFLQNLGVNLPGLEEMWPILPCLAGAALLVSFFTGKDRGAGRVFLGTAGLLVGLFFFAFTLGPLGWWEMEVYWPAYPLIGGMAFLATWVAGRRRESGLLVPAALNAVAGVVGFSFTLGWLEMWVLPVIETGWPLVLIAMGLLIVFRGFVPKRTA